MRTGDKFILLVGAIVILILLVSCAKPPERTWTINNIGKEFERQGII